MQRKAANDDKKYWGHDAIHLLSEKMSGPRLFTYSVKYNIRAANVRVTAHVCFTCFFSPQYARAIHRTRPES